MEHWTDGFEHSSVTDENRGAFNTHMAKFATQADAVADGYGLAQMKGKPAKLPESMEGFADDNARAEFRTGARRLLGIEHAADIAGLGDVNLKAGLAEGAKFDEAFATTFKQFVVDKKIPKSAVTDIAEFFNIASGKAGQAMAAAAKAAEDQAAAKFVSDKRACNDALVAHADFANQETVDKQNILLHRALKDNAGISVEEADGVSEFLRDREGATNPVIRRLLIKAYAPMAAESSTDGGDGKPAGNKSVMSEAEQKKDDEVADILHWKKK